MKTNENIKSAIEATVQKVNEILKEKGRAFIAIDGNCAAGKTTFAKALSEEFNCNVFHMDDFFLTPEMRTAERLSETGGNVHRERFLKEVLLPLKNKEDIFYRVYDCETLSFKEPVKIAPEKIVVTEGSYSCHPDLFDFYDLHIFLEADREMQEERIKKRNGENALRIFKEKWIPLENRYFEEFHIKEKCEMVFNIG